MRRGGPLRRGIGRIVGAAFVLWAVATITFFAIHLVPGDPAQAILGGPGSQASAEALDQVRAEYGFDDPLVVQYVHTLAELVSGDLGYSYELKTPVADVIGGQLWNTLLLAFASLAIAWVVAIGLALWSTGPSQVSRTVAQSLELTAASLPHFWLATVLIAIFSTALAWFPPVSTGTVAGLVLPALTLAIPLAGFLAQLMRENLLLALEQPFSLSARARGETANGVRLRHALRHAAIPAVNLSGWALGYLISGAVVVETIFARPGLGRTILRAVELRDVPVVTGVVLLVAIVYVVMTVLSDVIARVIDPRTRARAIA